jgi:hypothetical protein
MQKLQFIVDFSVTGILWSTFADQIVDFNLCVGSKSSVNVRIYQETTQLENRRRAFLGKASYSYDVALEHYEFVKTLQSGRYIKQSGVELPFCYHGHEIVSVDGKFNPHQLLPARFLPIQLKEISEAADLRLRNSILRAIKIFRWRFGGESPSDPVTMSALYWNAGMKMASIVPGQYGTAVATTIAFMQATQPYLDEANRLLQSDSLEEPFSHQLHCQACELYKASHEEGAIVMAFVSLETRLKQFVCEKSEVLKLIFEKMQSPDVHRIFLDIVPKVSGLRPENWKLKHLSVPVQHLMQARNQLVHTGKVKSNQDLPDNYLEVVKEVLYLIDVLEGHDWAKVHLSRATLDCLGWKVHEGALSSAFKEARGAKISIAVPSLIR